MPSLSLPDTAETIRQARSSLLRQQLMQTLGKVTLTAGAAGLAGRGLLGLYNLGRRNLTAKPRSAYSPMLMDVPYPAEEEEQRSKSAEMPTGWMSDIGRIFKGDYAKDVSGIPWAWPATIGAGAVGLGGGWKLMDYVLNNQRSQERKTDLMRAKKDYEQALLEQQVEKRSELGADLDRLFDLSQEKGASLPLVPDKDQMGKILGAYLMTSGALTALTAPAIYQYFKKRQPGAILRKAQEKHRQSVAAMRPSPIYARPVPLLSRSPVQAAPNEDDLSGSPLDDETEG